MFQPSKEDREKYGMTEANRIFELMALAMVFFALVAFFLKILLF
ncbi:MAG: hypothetical protein AB8F94_05285 [Saprospiraceae bacterium]